MIKDDWLLAAFVFVIGLLAGLIPFAFVLDTRPKETSPVRLYKVGAPGETWVVDTYTTGGGVLRGREFLTGKQIVAGGVFTVEEVVE